jgi:hypothetical protein
MVCLRIPALLFGNAVIVSLKGQKLVNRPHRG